MKIKQYMQEVIKNGENGFTLSLVNGEIKPFLGMEGFLVSITSNEVNPETITESYIIRFLDSVRLLQTGYKNVVFGFWHDTETKKSYLDISLLVLDYEVAIRQGLFFNQKAIYNLENRKVIIL